MRDTVLGALVLSFFGLAVASLVLGFRRRPLEEVVTTGVVRGRAGLSIHPWRGHWTTAAVGWVFTVAVILLGFWYLQGSFHYAAAFCLMGGLAMGYVGWARATGRGGDGTLTLTPEGLHQLYAGSEVFVPWDDVRGLVTTPTDLIVETTRPAVPVHHMPPFLGRRKVVLPDAVSLPHRGLPPLPYQEMVELYSTNRVARDELGTPEAVDRARAALAAHA